MIGLFFGSFDPIHEGHIQLIKRALPDFDKIMVIPAWQNQLKNASTDYNHRVNMCKLAFENNNRVVVSSIESILLHGRSFVTTAEVLAHYACDGVRWILTDETVNEIDKWVDPKYLYDYPKKVYNFSKKHTTHSTDIRKHYEVSSERHPEVPESVHKYIIEHSLYKKYEKNWSYTIPDGPHKGTVLYSGRYTTISCVVYTIDEGFRFILATKRGKGCPDYVGYMNIVNGYIEGDETAEQAAIREIHEETGLSLNIDDLKFEGVESRPCKCNKGNIQLQYSIYVDPNSVGDITNKFSEPDEVTDIRWINTYDIDRYDWAFNNREVIDKVCQK